MVLGDRRLRSIAGCTSTSNFFSGWVFAALFILYLKEALGFGAFELGLMFGLGSLGGLAGALIASRLADRFGVGWTIVRGSFLSGAAVLPLPFVSGPPAFPVVTVCVFGTFLGGLIYNINQVSFRQAIVPLRLQGRLNARMRTIVWGSLPLGALAGGALGTLLGLRTALIVGVIGGTFAFLWVLFSPVRSIETMPTPTK